MSDFRDSNNPYGDLFHDEDLEIDDTPIETETKEEKFSVGSFSKILQDKSNEKKRNGVIMGLVVLGLVAFLITRSKK
jgi:hypothetical protein